MTRINEALTHRLCAWLLEHPGEWLTAEDASIKFDVPLEYARWSLSRCVRDRRIQRFSVYGAAAQQNEVSEQVSRGG